MRFVSIGYKIYDGGTCATILNVLGAIIKAFCWTYICRSCAVYVS